MASFDRGTKRQCPNCGTKYYDLNKDPIVSPYTGKEYPRSYFEEPAPSKPEKEKVEPAAEKKEAPADFPNAYQYADHPMLPSNYWRRNYEV